MTYHPNSDLGRMQISIDSKVCPACGSPKFTGKIICSPCFDDLPRPLQNAFKFRRGEPLLEARDEAMEVLKSMGVRPVEEKP